jgi:hypothetical protein
MTNTQWVAKLKEIAEKLPGTREDRQIHEIVAEPWDSGFEDCIYNAINLVEEYAREELGAEQ